MTLEDHDIVAEHIFVPYYMYLRSDGIMYIRITDEKEETLESVKEMVEIMGKMVNYKPVPLLGHHLEFSLPGKENREYWASKESCPYSKADAFIIQTTAMKLISNFYMKFNKPARPTRMFTNEEEAIEWLKTFL